MSKGKKNSAIKGGGLLPALCSLIGTVLLIGVIILLIPMSTPRLFGYDMYNVVSGSMEPYIPVGSMIFVQSADPLDIVEDEVIAFYRNGAVVTHRVVMNNRTEGFFRTKGDANQEEDMNEVLYKELIGLVKYHVPVLGDLSSTLSSSFGKVYLLALIFLGLLLHLLGIRLKELLE